MGRVKNYDLQDVLNRARELFWTQGYAKTSVQDLEKATGVNKSGLYSEFNGKDEMFVECLKQYSDTSGIEELMTAEPLGWGNIKNLLTKSNCPKGPKGCFLVNTIRDYNILPAKAKTHVTEKLAYTKSLILKNLKAENIPTAKAQVLADMIMTFHQGIALKTNLGGSCEFKNEIEHFLKMIQGE